MSTAIAQLIVGADNDVELGPPNGAALQDTTDGSYPINATVVGTLYDARGTAVPNATAIPLAYVNGTTGANTLYRGVIPHTVTLIVGAAYEFRATATDASGNVRPFNLACIAVKG
jgi:hypothetical protein